MSIQNIQLIEPRGVEYNKKQFLLACEKIQREGMAQLLEWLVKTDFFTAPASIDEHGSYTGGLAEHHLNVYMRLSNLVGLETGSEMSAAFKNTDPNKLIESVAVVGLLHDLCNANCFKMIPGKSEYYRDDAVPYGHGEKSVYIVTGFMKLTREEAFAIRYHDCNFSDANTKAAFNQTPLLTLLYTADIQAKYLNEAYRRQMIENKSEKAG